MRRLHRCSWGGRTGLLVAGAAWLLTLAAHGQSGVAAAQEPAPDGAAQSAANAAPAAAITLDEAITLEEAIRRAEANEPQYAAAAAESKAAGLDRWIARSAMLPTAEYHNQALYTEPNGQTNKAGQTGNQSAPIFIANNAVREYASQASITETLGVAGYAAARRADAASARAAAELEVTRRGLLAAVTNLYYGAIAAENKLAVAERAQTEAGDFSQLTAKREQARESAHADVLKSQLEEQQRERDVEDARLGAERAHLELGVLLFADPRTAYKLAPGDAAQPLPTREEAERAAAKNNPELKSALAALKESDADVLAARAAYLPDIGMNFTYGIDAPQFAVNGPDKVRNLGYSASVTVDIPVWDWLSTEHKVKQSEIRRSAAQVALTASQRRLIADLDETYREAETAGRQLASLDASVTTARESLRLTRLRYTGGEATVLEVVDAQTTLLTAENAREDGMVRYQAARTNLLTLTGTM